MSNLASVFEAGKKDSRAAGRASATLENVLSMQFRLWKSGGAVEAEEKI